MRLYLIGMPGCGKTTLGKICAESLKVHFIDLDYEIIKKEKMSISEIFLKKGEEYFRKIEKDFLENTLKFNNAIISTGGGIVKNYENILTMKKLGKIIYLNCSLNILEQRVSKNPNKRPLLKENSLSLLYLERKNIYETSCDYIINRDKNLQENKKEVIKIYEKESTNN